MKRFIAIFAALTALAHAQTSAPTTAPALAATASPATTAVAPAAVPASSTVALPATVTNAAPVLQTPALPTATAARRAVSLPANVAARSAPAIAPATQPSVVLQGHAAAPVITASATTVLSYSTPIPETPTPGARGGLAGTNGEAVKPYGGSQGLPMVASLDPKEPVGPFVLVDETGPQVLALYEQLSGKIILPQQTIPQVKINFNSRGTLSRTDALMALETLLTLNGISILPLNDNFVKAVPTSGINSQSPEILMIPDLQKLPPSQIFFTRVFKLNSLTPTEAAPLLAPMLTAIPQGAATLVPFEKARAILVTDTLANLQRMDRVLARIDRAEDFDSTVLFFPLKYAKASEMVARMQRLQGSTLKRSLSGTATSFEADDRTNQLMVITDPVNVPLLRQIVGGLDVDIDPLTRSEVFYIQQADATELADVLKQLVTGQQQAAKQASTQAQKNAQNAKATKTNAQTKQTTKVDTAASSAAAASSRAEVIPTLFGEENNSYEFSQFVTIVPDERSNSIVVYGTPTDIRQVAGIIGKMDISRMQVRVEVVITEVTLTDQQVSGLESFSLSGVNMNKGDWRIDASGQTPSIDSATDPAFSFTLDDYNLDMVFNVAKRDSHVRVLSAPSITTTHNEEGSIQVVEERPRVTSSTTNLNAQTATDSTQVTQEIEWIDIGITLKLEEVRVGPNGSIQMRITQTASNVIEYQTIANISTPIIASRQAKSFVTAHDGQVVVLGGLQSISEIKSEGKVTFWSEIPLLGNLFKPKTGENVRKELIIFLRPMVVRSNEIANTLTQTQVKNSGMAEDLKEFYENGTLRLTSEKERDAKLKEQQEKEAAKKAKQAQKSASAPPTTVTPSLRSTYSR